MPCYRARSEALKNTGFHKFNCFQDRKIKGVD
jgi:hypothetical protein